jgi:hypothetical protein
VARKQYSESYCLACEKLMLEEREKFEVCSECFKKTRRHDPLMSAAIARAVVAVVPTLCPHEENHGRCRFKTPKYFNVIVLDRNLEPTAITGPYTERGAEREAKKIRVRIDRRKK